MLLAFICDGAVGCSRGLYERAVRSLGRPNHCVTRGAGQLLAWGNAHVVDRTSSWAAEGRIAFSGERTQSELVDLAATATGDFSFVGLDGNGLVLASGAAGGYRPLYVSAAPGRVVACTSFWLATELMVSRPVLDPDALAGLVTPLTLFRSPSNSTPFSNVRRIPMHEVWRVDLDGRTTRRPSFRPLARAGHSAGAPELAVELREALSGAVGRALAGHDHAGVMASGGVDSSSVLALAMDLKRRGRIDCDLHAFFCDYGETPGDDRPYLFSLARHLGIEPDRSTFEETAAVGTTFVQDGMPFYAAGAPLLVAMSVRVRARRVSVLLTGVGGDDVVDGEPRLYSSLARAHPFRAAGSVARLKGPGMGNASSRLWRFLLRPLIREVVPVPGGVTAYRRRRGQLRRYPWAGPVLRRYLASLADVAPTPKPQLDWTAAERFEALARSPYVRQWCIARTQMEAITGCALRDPFFDDDFLRAVASIPPLELMRGDFRRGLLREAMRGLLPEEIRVRETKAVVDPAMGRFVDAGGGFAALGSLAGVQRLADLQIAEPRAFRRVFDELARRPDRARWFGAWPALAVEAWLRKREARS